MEKLLRELNPHEVLLTRVQQIETYIAVLLRHTGIAQIALETLVASNKELREAGFPESVFTLERLLKEEFPNAAESGSVPPVLP